MSAEIMENEMRVHPKHIVLCEEYYKMKNKKRAVPQCGSLHSSSDSYQNGMLKNVQDIFSNETGFV